MGFYFLSVIKGVDTTYTFTFTIFTSQDSVAVGIISVCKCPPPPIPRPLSFEGVRERGAAMMAVNGGKKHRQHGGKRTFRAGTKITSRPSSGIANQEWFSCFVMHWTVSEEAAAWKLSKEPAEKRRPTTSPLTCPCPPKEPALIGSFGRSRGEGFSHRVRGGRPSPKTLLSYHSNQSGWLYGARDEGHSGGSWHRVGWGWGRGWGRGWGYKVSPANKHCQLRTTRVTSIPLYIRPPRSLLEESMVSRIPRQDHTWVALPSLTMLTCACIPIDHNSPRRYIWVQQDHHWNH